jgi:hypothetical protein
MKNLNQQIIDPAYVQIRKKEAAAILGFSITELDRRRTNDPNCPKGFKERDDRMAPVKFRLSDVYTYSKLLMQRSVVAKTR